MPANTLFKSQDAEAMIARIERLRPDARAQWGKMSVGQMLAHCQMPLKVAMGQHQLSPSLIGKLFGRMIKKKVFAPGDYAHNKPTHPDFRIKETRDFAREKTELLRLVRAFAQGGPPVLMKGPHPFFGPMTQDEWETLMWKHLDHHMRQFGV